MQQPGAPPRRMRLVTFVVSEFGSFGGQATALLRALASRVGRSVPSSLIDESSWATPSFAPFARSAIALEVRRRAAVLLRDSVSMDEAFDLHSAWDLRRAREAADASSPHRCTRGSRHCGPRRDGRWAWRRPRGALSCPGRRPGCSRPRRPASLRRACLPYPHSIPTPHPAHIPATTRRWAAGLVVASHSLGP